MKTIEINYLQPLTGIFSKRRERVTIPPGTTLSKFLDDLFFRYREQFKRYEIDPARQPMVTMLNGKTVSSKDLEIELNDNDSVVLWMPVAGG